MADRLTKKELKDQKKLRELEVAANAKKQETVKWVVIGAVAVLFVGFFSYLIISAKQKQAALANTPVTFQPTGHAEGTSSAKLTITEFGDFECPACRAFFPVTQQILATYPKQVRLIYKYFPLTSIHKNAFAGAQAAQSAGDQGKFWQMANLLYTNQDAWAQLPDPTPIFTEYAKQLNLDMSKYQSDYNSQATKNEITKEQNEGSNLGIIGTPTFYINGHMIQNPNGFAGFKQIINSYLQK